jgi:predicted GNAT family acetyltransferase
MNDPHAPSLVDRGDRLTLAFDGGAVFSDYRRHGDVLALTHVEADPALRNTGAAGRFMAAAVAWARAKGVKLQPVCSYAVHWFARHPEAGDVVG